MKKMMIAVGFAMMFAAAGCQLCDEPKPEVYSRSFVGMDKATVMFEWAKAWQELDKPKERDKIGLEVFVDDKNAWRGTYVKIPVGANEETMREIVSATLEEAPFKDSKRWESFDLALADCGWWTFDLQLEYRRLAVSFDANGIVTNQCEITRTFRDAHGAENAQVADCVKGPVHAREFIIQDSSGQYSELKPMLGNSFGERLELWGVVDKQTNARTGVEYTLRLERSDIKEKIYVRGDKALLDQVCNRKIWMVGYESVSEISPFEQNWMYEMFVIPVQMQCGYGYKRFFKLVQILNSEPQTRQQKADSGVSVFRPLLARGFGEPAYATGILCRRDCQGENRYYIDFRFPRLGTQGGKEIQVVFEFGDGGCYPPQPDPDFHRPKGRPMEAMKIDLDSLCGKCLSFVGIESIVQERDPSWVKGDAAATNTGLIRRYTVVSLPNIIDYADSEWYFIK